MCARAAEVESFERRSILRPANQRPEREELIDRLFAVVNVSAAETVRLFEIARRDHLASDDRSRSPGAYFSNCAITLSANSSRRWSNRLLQLVRRKLHVNRHHVFARRRERGSLIDGT